MSKPLDVRVQGRDGARWWFTAPNVVDETACRHYLIGTKEQSGQHGGLSWRVQCELSPVVRHYDRAEYTESQQSPSGANRQVSAFSVAVDGSAMPARIVSTGYRKTPRFVQASSAWS
jgi:hypothetical protein